MPQIVLTDEQARVLLAATEPVELRDERGTLLARISPPVEEVIVEARQRQAAEQRRVPAAQVQALLARLAEMRKQEEMDETKLHQLLARFRAGEQI
jgi:hypothetical protein